MAAYQDLELLLCRVCRSLTANRAILESLKHRNIVQMIQKIKDPKNERIYIVMEVRHSRIAYEISGNE